MLRRNPDALVVWPEELAIYYFSDTLAPSRWTILIPGILPTTEQHNYTAELDRKGVNYVVLNKSRNARISHDCFRSGLQSGSSTGGCRTTSM